MHYVKHAEFFSTSEREAYQGHLQQGPSPFTAKPPSHSQVRPYIVHYKYQSNWAASFYNYMLKVWSWAISRWKGILLQGWNMLQSPSFQFNHLLLLRGTKIVEHTKRCDGSSRIGLCTPWLSNYLLHCDAVTALSIIIYIMDHPWLFICIYLLCPLLSLWHNHDAVFMLMYHSPFFYSWRTTHPSLDYPK